MHNFLGFSKNSDRIVAVCFADMIRTLGRSSTIILLPIYFLTLRHSSYFIIGLVVAAGYLFAAPFSMMGGTLADRIGRRPLFTVLPMLSAIVFLLMSIEIFTGIQLWILYLTFIFASPIGTLQGTVDSSVLSDLTQSNERIKAFSLLRLFSNVGFALGPALGGFVSTLGYSLLLLVPTAGNLIEELVYLALVRESMTDERNEEDIRITPGRSLISFPYADRSFMLIIGIIVVASVCLGQWGTTLTLFLSGSYHLSVARIGLMYSLNGVVVVLFQMPVNRLMAKFHDIDRLAAGVLIYAISFIMFGLFSVYYLILITTAILTIAENIFSPAVSTLISKIAPSNRRGEYFGAYSAVNAFTSPLFIVFGAFLLTSLTHSPLLIWAIVSLFGFISSMLFIFSKKKIPSARLTDYH
ncbi:MAG: MFS transporter [Candidatus Thermoplasmatota archaeon]|nr:MFS transporter [Candidatus Thermoplasmatota archaeon]MCL5253482.1 MFS transporter [Candidatus Thermoplasmatota archaeon]